MTRSMTQAGAHMETVCFALRDTTVVDFVRAVVRAGYRERFSADQDRAERIVEDAFDLLAGSQVEGVDVAQLVQTTSHLIRETFRKGDATFWFNQGYHAYKTRLKPETDFAQLEHLIPGRRVLDFGCGSGYLAARLARGGFKVFAADVLDYRYEEARHLPFVQMSSAADLRYPKDCADTALVQAVLHHVDPEHLPQVLTELSRVAKYLLIKEDTYGLTPNLEGYGEALATQELLRTFVAMASETQHQVLVLIDFFANAIAQGVPEMNMPFDFKTVAEWQLILGNNGFGVERVRVVGFEPGRVHKSCHVWILCQRTMGA